MIFQRQLNRLRLKDAGAVELAIVERRGHEASEVSSDPKRGEILTADLLALLVQVVALRKWGLDPICRPARAP